jgi:hypothetical protein
VELNFLTSFSLENIMNLNTHIMFALALGLSLFHNNTELAILVAIGAALPDLDREYMLLWRRIFSKLQLHRALLHNVFFIILLSLFNQYLALGALTHIILDSLTSPSDRGVELFFPLSRIVRDYKLDYEGKESKIAKGISWYLEDPRRLISKTADKDLREVSKEPWTRIYGPFKNNMIIDWSIFYSSLFYIIILEHSNGGFFTWLIQFFELILIKYMIITLGIVIFYLSGEIWRRGLSENRIVVIFSMIVGFSMMLYQGRELYNPLNSIPWSLIHIALLSFIVGFIIATFHVIIKRKIGIL